jgi:hypothetical protein
MNEMIKSRDRAAAPEVAAEVRAIDAQVLDLLTPDQRRVLVISSGSFTGLYEGAIE